MFYFYRTTKTKYLKNVFALPLFSSFQGIFFGNLNFFIILVIIRKIRKFLKRDILIKIRQIIFVFKLFSKY